MITGFHFHILDEEKDGIFANNYLPEAELLKIYGAGFYCAAFLFSSAQKRRKLFLFMQALSS